MIKRPRQTTFVFNLIAVIILVGSFTVYNLFERTKQHIETTAINSQIQYISDVTNNMSDSIRNLIKADMFETLKTSINLREEIESSLRFFITDRYRYIYIVDKDDNNMNEFRFLLDASKNEDEKSEFEEPYIPLNIDAWNNVYKTKKENYFRYDGNENIWITYLKPIVIDGEVSAIIAIDFSLQTSEIIISTLNELTISFQILIVFSIIIFFVIAGFSYMDSKREKAKALLYSQLKETNIILQNKTEELEDKSEKISEFNKTLTQKVEDEVTKNREKDKQILEQSRLAQMGEMIGMIAHQWRQPLAAISSTSAAINLKATLGKLDPSIAIELSSKISEYSQHLSTTIDDFRGFFKPNKEVVKTNFTDLTNSVLGIVEMSIKNHSINIIKDLQHHDSFISYPNELKQVILNLIKNAEDILIDKSIQDPYIKISSYQEDNAMVLEISDNGGGISDEILEKVFDPYFSTKKEKDGTGLGLYMSKTIVETHCDGTLTVKNGVDGAIFKISFLLESIK